ncbi:hypothetical protein C8Q78DRAFT_1082931 [Trametes maxima]|nr:hypothetical protein C8Q78DRAFT_1082931 [Trametes maxima]
MASTPEPLPSIPPSPSPSPSPVPPDDIARVWHDDEPPKKRLSAVQKGKKRAVPKRRGAGSGTDDDDDDEDEEEEEDEDAAKGYPPTKEEIAESRKIEENLRRWEVAERQRRKAARESLASTSGQSTAPSLLADLRSSLFRRDSSRKVPISGAGTHQVLRSDDRDAEPVDLDLDRDHEALQLEPIQTPTTAAFSAPPTPEPSPHRDLYPDPDPEPENPFDTPSASRTSLNIPAASAIMTESDSAPTFTSGETGSPPGKKKGPTSKRPTLLEAPSPAASRAAAKKQPPPPKPIDLPAPRSPPPRTDTRQAGKPPELVPPPRVAPAERREPETAADPGPPVRWWHEWLCGCGEGPDRGGDHQAGRTNPFE